MASKYRRIYPDAETIIGLGKASTLVEVGDLCYDDGTNFLPAVQLGDQGGDAANQTYFAAHFVGISNDQRLTVQTTTGNFTVVGSGTFEYPCAATDWAVGDYIAAAGNGSTTGLLSQQVAKTTDASGAIGFSIQNTAAGATLIQGRFVGITARAFPITASITGALTITSNAANALSVGRLGATTPALAVDASASTSITGVTIVAAATGGGVLIKATGGATEVLTIQAKGAAIILGSTVASSTSFTITPAASGAGLAMAVSGGSGNEALTFDAVGSGTIKIGSVSTGAISLGATGKFVVTQTTGVLTLADSANLVFGSSTGSKLGTATTQKLGFYNATPVTQPAANTDTTTGAAGSTTTIYLNTTFVGSSGTAAYSVGGVVTALKSLGLLAP